MALHEVKLCLLGVSDPPSAIVCGLQREARPQLLCFRPWVCVYLSTHTHYKESGVGKTCLVNRFVSDVFTENESLTVG